MDINAVENLLSNVLREKSGFELSDLDRTATFMELGFDSLFLIQLSQEIKTRFRVKVAFRELIEDVSSIDLLVPHLAELAEGETPPQPIEQVVNEPAAALAPALPQPNPVAIAPVASPGSQPAHPPEPVPNPIHVSQTVAPPVNMMPNSPMVNSLGMTGLEQVISQHNQLMQQHLLMLQGQPVVSTVPTAVPTMPAAPETLSSVAVNSQDEAPLPATQDCCEAQPPKADAAKKHERFGPYKPVRRGSNMGLTAQQNDHLTEFMTRYCRKTPKSRELAQVHRDHFADPRGVAGYRRIWKSMVYQIAVEKSKGSKLWDVDGNEYVDIAMGFGLNLFGQSPDFVTDALHDQLQRGVEVGPQSPIAGEVAQLLCDLSRKDRVTFCNTGSEAVMAALRLARTVNGKSKFVFFNKDYHGNFDQVLVRSNSIGSKRQSSPAAPGVPQSFADNAIVLDYGTPEALAVIRDRADEIAAVLIEPVQSADPFIQPKEFLQEIREITQENGIAMIMDEVITGFRSAMGGAQEWFDVWGDMATYGKVLGGGMPIGALAGTSEYMDALDGGTWNYDDESEPDADMTFFAGTFVRHPLAIRAAQQVLMRVKEEGPELQTGLTAKTTRLVNELNAFFEKELFPIRVAQFTSLFRFMFPPDLEFADMLYFHLLDRGIFTRGWGDNCFLSTEHSEADVDRVIQAVQDSCLEIRAGGFFPDASTDESPEMSSPQERNNGKATAISSAQSDQCLQDTVKTMVEIQGDGTKPPLFCLPAADGLTLVYRALSQQLGEDQPVYGLDSPGVFGEALPDTLEEMAANMVKEIREFRPHGPYLIAGYCSGGTLALEVAQQLIDSGEHVAMLACIETYNWLDAPSTNPTRATQAYYEFQRLEFHIRNFFLLGTAEKIEFVNSKWNVMKVRARVWKNAFTGWIRRKKKLAPKQAVDMDALWRIHDDLSEAYVPKPYRGKIIHFRPRQDYKCHIGTELEATGGVKVHRLPVYPAGMMVNPFVKELATRMRGAIDAGLAGVGACNESVPSESRAPVAGRATVLETSAVSLGL